MTAAVALAPQLHELSEMVMADTLHALFCICAMFSLSIYLKKRRAVFVLAAGLSVALAFWTKYNAVLLAIAIPLTIVISRAWWILRRKAAWAAAAIVAVLVGGWEMWAMRWVFGLVEHTTTLPEAIRFYSQALVSVLGLPILLLALAGGASAAAGAVRKHAPMRPIFAASISLIVGTWLFHSMLPHETFERYMLPAVPAAVILAAHGIETLTRRLPAGLAPRVVSVLVWAGILGVQAYGAMHAPISRDSVYPFVAQFVLHNIPPGGNGVVLVSSDRDGEGALIAEVASREPQPRLWLLRASKVLGHSGWHGEDYKLRFKSDDDVLKYLDSVPVEMIVIDPPSDWRQLHHSQLRAVIAAHPEHFSLLLHTQANERCRGDYCDVEVYRSKVPASIGLPQIGVDPKEMIGRKLFKDWEVNPALPSIPK
jgi:4-amino-4-deoxy-L-arabinose transferase-like glycosyltransferase